MRRARLVALFVLSLGVALYALGVYGLLPVGERVHPALRASLREHTVGIRIHVFGAAVALLCGPFQLLPRLRTARPRLHRWLGRVYLSAGVLVGGAAGLYMAQFAFGGLPGRLGFATLALVWLATGARAWTAIRGGDIATHRRWMTRNFALTFAAVTLRLYLPLALVAGIPFETAYPVIAWACWLPNLAAAEWLVRKGRSESQLSDERRSPGRTT